MKGLGDIDGRIIDTDRLSRSFVRGAVGVSFRKNPVQYLTGQRSLIDFEIEISVYRGNFGNYFVYRKILFERFRNGNGAFAEYFRKFETGKSVVSHVRRGRKRDESVNLLDAHALYFQFLRNVSFIIHVLLFLLRKFYKRYINIFFRF